MSKIKTLSQQFPELTVSLLDAIKLIDPSGDKRTYCELLTKLVKNKYEDDLNEVRLKETYDEFKYETKLDDTDLVQNNLIWIRLMHEFVAGYIGREILDSVKKLHELREKKVITTDISSYRNIKDVLGDISVAELKNMDSELQKKIERVYEDQEWLILKPLTYESSRKYGSGTRWCTTSSDTSEYFNKYAHGILIYVLNKVNGLKVAVHADLRNGKYQDLSFWNQTDQRVDSMETGLPVDVLQKIREELSVSYISNLGIAAAKGLFDGWAENMKKTRSVEEPMPIEEDIAVIDERHRFLNQFQPIDYNNLFNTYATNEATRTNIA